MIGSSLYSYAANNGSLNNDSFRHILLRFSSTSLMNSHFALCFLTLLQVAGM